MGTKSSAISDIINKDTDWSRYELSKTGNPRSEENNALLRGINSTNFYFSLANKNIFSFNQSIENNINSDYEYYGLDSRAELGTLANSKYYAKLKLTLIKIFLLVILIYKQSIKWSRCRNLSEYKFPTFWLYVRFLYQTK